MQDQPEPISQGAKQYQQTLKNELVKTFCFLKFASAHFAIPKQSKLTSKQAISHMLENSLNADFACINTYSTANEMADGKFNVRELLFLKLPEKELISFAEELATWLTSRRTDENKLEIDHHLTSNPDKKKEVEDIITELAEKSKEQIDSLSTSEIRKKANSGFNPEQDTASKIAIFDTRNLLQELTINRGKSASDLGILAIQLTEKIVKEIPSSTASRSSSNVVSSQLSARADPEFVGR